MHVNRLKDVCHFFKVLCEYANDAIVGMRAVMFDIYHELLIFRTDYLRRVLHYIVDNLAQFIFIKVVDTVQALYNRILVFVMGLPRCQVLHRYLVQALVKFLRMRYYLPTTLCLDILLYEFDVRLAGEA